MQAQTTCAKGAELKSVILIAYCVGSKGVHCETTYSRILKYWTTNKCVGEIQFGHFT